MLINEEVEIVQRGETLQVQTIGFTDIYALAFDTHFHKTIHVDFILHEIISKKGMTIKALIRCLMCDVREVVDFERIDTKQ